MIGRVVSTKSKNTATVLVERKVIHPIYKKGFKRSKKYLVDDGIGVRDGDIVEFEKCRPISKMKHFKILKVLGQNLAEIAEAQLKEKAEEAISEVMPEEKDEGETVKGEEVTTEKKVKVVNDQKLKSNKRKNRKEDKQEDKGE